ncbi:MAG: slipin family protein [Planctomycetes bacterium]|nr:slipin family protein [Planctomycetota bacterium]
MNPIVRIRQHERGLHFRHGNFARLLMPGTYWFPSRLISARRDEVQIVNTLGVRFEHQLLDLIVQHDSIRDQLMLIELGDQERAIVWRNDKLFALLGPGRHAFWRAPADLKVETHDIGEFKLNHPRIEAICALAGTSLHLTGVEVAAHETAMIFRDGKLIETVGEGSHVYWKGAGKVTWKSVDRRELVADVAGQEIMTRDKVTLRVNLVVTYRVIDPVAAVMNVDNYSQTLYREAQLALRAAVGVRPLDELLRDKESIGGEVREALAKRASEFGVNVVSVGLRDIILPGDMKTILNQVIAAEKQAEANLIRRREETAAARSQANTAKLLAENPTLARLRELELLQEILSGAKATFVFGQGDLSNQVRSLIGQNAASNSAV